jgi:multidrug efflux pump subunit AcrA (membrane-fusion protein)
VEKAAAEARAREGERARGRLEFELAQMKEARGGRGAGVGRGEGRGGGRLLLGFQGLVLCSQCSWCPNVPGPPAPVLPPAAPQRVKALDDQLAASSEALDAKASELLALQRASGDAALRLQRELAAAQSALDDARGAEDTARRRAGAAEQQLAVLRAQQAEAGTRAAEREAGLTDQLRGALAQAERCQELAANEQAKREEVRALGESGGFGYGVGPGPRLQRKAPRLRASPLNPAPAVVPCRPPARPRASWRRCGSS